MERLVKRREGRKRRPRTMDLRTLSRVLSTTIARLEDDLLATDDPEEARKTAHALATVCGPYIKLLEVLEIDERLERLEGAA